VSDEPQPGLAEVRLTEYDGSVHSLIDKTAIFERPDVRLTRDMAYPFPIEIECDAVGDDPGGEDSVTVVIRWAGTEAGRRRFRVSRTGITRSD